MRVIDNSFEIVSNLPVNYQFLPEEEESCSHYVKTEVETRRWMTNDGELCIVRKGYLPRALLVDYDGGEAQEVICLDCVMDAIPKTMTASGG